MKLRDLLHHLSRTLAEERAGASARGLDAPVTATEGHRVATAGTLHQYAFTVPADALLMEDLPVTLVFPGDMEPTEGFVVGRHENVVVVQTFDAFGQAVEAVTIVPDATGFFDT
ncbi:MAG: hypothetical protein HY581_08245, partial [Nitrospirae bacterium]|nr:hypothetical protein [Nitrospirota bacterium]